MATAIVPAAPSLCGFTVTWEAIRGSTSAAGGELRFEAEALVGAASKVSWGRSARAARSGAFSTLLGLASAARAAAGAERWVEAAVTDMGGASLGTGGGRFRNGLDDLFFGGIRRALHSGSRKRLYTHSPESREGAPPGQGGHLHGGVAPR